MRSSCCSATRSPGVDQPAYITVCFVAGVIGYRIAFSRGQLFREGLFQFMTSFRSTPIAVRSRPRRGAGESQHRPPVGSRYWRERAALWRPRQHLMIPIWHGCGTRRCSRGWGQQNPRSTARRREKTPALIMLRPVVRFHLAPQKSWWEGVSEAPILQASQKVHTSIFWAVNRCTRVRLHRPAGPFRRR